MKTNPSKKYYLKNLKKERSRRYEYYLSHKHEWAPRRRKWYLTVMGRFNHIRDSAKTRKINFQITKEFFVNWYEKQNKKCIYCRRSLIPSTWKQGTSPSIDRKDNSLGYIEENIALCCVGCNQVKGHNFTFEEMILIGKTLRKIYKKHVIPTKTNN